MRTKSVAIGMIDTPKDQPKNKPLVESVENLRIALLHSFWNDDVGLIPSVDAPQACEIWLRTPAKEYEAASIAEFRDVCGALDIPLRDGHISFPERIVVLIEANAKQLADLISSIDNLAEFRRAKETADFWTGMDNAQQAEWAQNLATRLSVDAGTKTSACVIDTGANNGHPLLAPLLADADCGSVDTEWGTSDEDGHGTSMCGNVAFGDNLGHWLQTDTAISLPYKLESIKLIPKSGHKEDQNLNGYRTSQAVARAEISNPDFTRAICMAITSTDGRDRGRPSSWSGMIDALAAGVDDENESRRLFVLSAGNVRDASDWANYPTSNVTSDIHDPGQSWNALTVGAVTFKDHIANEDMANIYTPIATAGQLSPYSTTSMMWDSKWPNKPDIVLEGGNAAVDGTNFTTQLEDLSLLSLNHKPQLANFTGNYATSAASALATEQAARLHAQYPSAWPETIRGLMVHSAQWTQQLRNQFSEPGNSQKANRERLLRACGYGIPSMERAISSATNSLTMVVEGEIQPFQEKEKNGFKANDMHFYALPWPKEALNDLPLDTMVTIDVTLSYFIEPGPGEIGWRDKYRYRSHGLDFNLKKPTESLDEFITRLNKAAREDDDTDYGGSGVDWQIGEKKGRTRGSIHRDWVEMTAAEAAEAGVVGVFPRSGWWKERPYLGKGNSKARYSLIIAIRTPNTDVDIYTPVAIAIKSPIQV
ncbi:subtilisin proteinase [Phaeobacter inhibens]|uniref:S8 family peptidase n=1 Tax=Phaeobacter inhibens TaxID=221822 RepID=UPI00275754F1|nr:S8 family peptidase [Phaeobacter inhibens]GLO71341.1 subtilisin proteinase [Phaeobacter inhibens]